VTSSPAPPPPSTLVNKGPEIIEAHYLSTPYDRIDDGASAVHRAPGWSSSYASRLNARSPPNMWLPISLGLDWPNRCRGGRPGTGPPRAPDPEPLDAEVSPGGRSCKTRGREGVVPSRCVQRGQRAGGFGLPAGQIGYPRYRRDRCGCRGRAPVIRVSCTRESPVEAEHWHAPTRDRRIARG
jgi:1-deoxy-D-xylulose-5-phosphate reductoisomerase